MSKEVDVIIIDHSREVIDLKDEAVIKFLEEAGLHLEGDAKEALEMDPRRVDTGLLRNSITHALSGEPPAIKTYHGDNPSKYDTVQAVPIGRYSGAAPEEPKGKMSVYVGTNVEYAVPVHEGHITASGGHVAPNRFIRNAFELNRGQLKDKLEEALKNA